jgi:hypothetical protein
MQPGIITTSLLFPIVFRRLSWYLRARRVELHPYVELFLVFGISAWVPLGLTLGTGFGTIFFLGFRDKGGLGAGVIMAPLGWLLGLLIAVLPVFLITLLGCVIYLIVDLVWFLVQKCLGRAVGKGWLAERGAERYERMLAAFGSARDEEAFSPGEILLVALIGFPIVVLIALHKGESFLAALVMSGVVFGPACCYLFLLNLILFKGMRPK